MPQARYSGVVKVGTDLGPSPIEFQAESIYDQMPHATVPATLSGTMSAESLTQQWLRQNVSSYPHKDRLFLDIDTALARFPTIRPKSDVYSSVFITFPSQSHELIFLLQPTMMAALSFFSVFTASFQFYSRPLHITFQSPCGSPKTTPANPP